MFAIYQKFKKADHDFLNAVIVCGHLCFTQLLAVFPIFTCIYGKWCPLVKLCFVFSLRLKRE